LIVRDHEIDKKLLDAKIDYNVPLFTP